MQLPTWLRRSGLGLIALCVTLAPALLSAPAASAHGVKESKHHTWYVRVGLETEDHAIQVMTFSPSELWINKGDKVVWVSDAAELHTVTFTSNGAPPPQPFTGAPNQLVRTTTGVFQPNTFLSSGPMAEINPQLGPDVPYFHTFALKFNSQGVFPFYCWVHPMMMGTIHVNPAGTRYPHTQQWYDRQTAILRAKSIWQARILAQQTEKKATNHLVFIGAGNDMVDYMRFIRQDVTIHVGESVTFTNPSFGPHTVNIGPEIASPFMPVGDPTSFNGTGSLASGILLHEQSYTITFKTAGTYDYYCALHDYMGMVGVVHVEA